MQTEWYGRAVPNGDDVGKELIVLLLTSFQVMFRARTQSNKLVFKRCNQVFDQGFLRRLDNLHQSGTSAQEETPLIHVGSSLLSKQTFPDHRRSPFRPSLRPPPPPPTFSFQRHPTII